MEASFTASSEKSGFRPNIVMFSKLVFIAHSAESRYSHQLSDELSIHKLRN